MISPGLAPLVLACARELDAIGADWAIGGATAMAVHGYERATRDVDLFVGDDARDELLGRLARRGLHVDEVFPPSHYAVRPRRSTDPDERVDLLFPALGVESLGLMAATPAPLLGRQLPVLPLEHVVAAKLTVDPVYERARHERDTQDLEALRVRGLVDARRVEGVLRDAGERGAIARLRRLLRGRAPR